MFTGIVKGCGRIEKIVRRPGLVSFEILLPAGSERDLEIGASVAVDGACLTVTKIVDEVAHFDVMLESLNRTTLGKSKEKDLVNIERSAKDGAEIGGHPLSGHVDCTAQIIRIDSPENNYVITFQVTAEWMRYLFAKGYVALNGASLTIASIDRSSHSFTVWLIPETLRLTTFGSKKVGDLVNLEVERSTQVMVDTVRQFLEEKFGPLLPQIAQSIAKLGL